MAFAAYCGPLVVPTWEPVIWEQGTVSDPECPFSQVWFNQMVLSV